MVQPVKRVVYEVDFCLRKRDSILFYMLWFRLMRFLFCQNYQEHAHNEGCTEKSTIVESCNVIVINKYTKF